MRRRQRSADTSAVLKALRAAKLTARARFEADDYPDVIVLYPLLSLYTLPITYGHPDYYPALDALMSRVTAALTRAKIKHKVLSLDQVEVL